MKYLLFRLYGPMCSWGDIAVGETRPSYCHPSKSAVLGLVAAALGIKRDETEKQNLLVESLGFAVVVDDPGVPLSDYHTAQVPSGKARYSTRRDELAFDRSDLNTILSTRDYRMDALYIVALWVRPSSVWSLAEIVKKLKEPEYVLYLGRKACPPALPLEPQIVEGASIKEALGAAAFMDLNTFGIKPAEQKMLYWEEDGVAGVEHQHCFERRDVPLSRVRWQFDTRKELHATIAGEEDGA